MEVIIEYTLILGVIALILYIFYYAAKRRYPEIIHDHWWHYFPETQFSSQEFYKSIETILKDRKIPDTNIFTAEFKERSALILPRFRTYLRVRSGSYSFDICVAPYGVGSFVSWWFGEDVGCLMRLLFFIPFLGPYLKRKVYERTYFIVDSQDAFEDAVHLAVLNTIDSMTNEKGLRTLTEVERLPRSKRRNS